MAFERIFKTGDIFKCKILAFSTFIMKGTFLAFILLVAIATIQQAVALPGHVVTGGRCPFTIFVATTLSFLSVYVFSFWIFPALGYIFQYFWHLISGLFHGSKTHKRHKHDEEAPFGTTGHHQHLD